MSDQIVRKDREREPDIFSQSISSSDPKSSIPIKGTHIGHLQNRSSTKSYNSIRSLVSSHHSKSSLKIGIVCGPRSGSGSITLPDRKSRWERRVKNEVLHLGDN